MKERDRARWLQPPQRQSVCHQQAENPFPVVGQETVNGVSRGYGSEVEHGQVFVSTRKSKDQRCFMLRG